MIVIKVSKNVVFAVMVINVVLIAELRSLLRYSYRVRMSDEFTNGSV